MTSSNCGRVFRETGNYTAIKPFKHTTVPFARQCWGWLPPQQRHKHEIKMSISDQQVTNNNSSITPLLTSKAHPRPVLAVVTFPAERWKIHDRRGTCRGLSPCVPMWSPVSILIQQLPAARTFTEKSAEICF